MRNIRKKTQPRLVALLLVPLPASRQINLILQPVVAQPVPVIEIQRQQKQASIKSIRPPTRPRSSLHHERHRPGLAPHTVIIRSHGLKHIFASRQFRIRNIPARHIHLHPLVIIPFETIPIPVLQRQHIIRRRQFDRHIILIMKKRSQRRQKHSLKFIQAITVLLDLQRRLRSMN